MGGTPLGMPHFDNCALVLYCHYDAVTQTTWHPSTRENIGTCVYQATVWFGVELSFGSILTRGGKKQPFHRAQMVIFLI